jgi:phosphoribosylglycinamide formyltransferase-1
MNYLKEDKNVQKRLRMAIFLSGTGTNAVNIIEYFSIHNDIEIALLLTNKADSGAERISNKYNIPFAFFEKNEFVSSDVVLNNLKENHIDYIILAGFLWLMPQNILSNFPDKIINIHPALLPKYGGKGMYGSKVHESVVENKESLSGITIHLVNQHYDEGEVLFQASCMVGKEDNADMLAKKIHELEYNFFPKVIEAYIKGLVF